MSNPQPIGWLVYRNTRCWRMLMAMVCVLIIAMKLAEPQGVVKATPVQQTFSCASVTQISTPECEALVALYNQTAGPSWTSPDNWLATDTPCDDWFGIECASNQITQIYLGFNGLNGPIPSEVGNLVNLIEFTASGNQLHGGIPSSMSRLTKLAKLDLSGNQLTGPIPIELTTLPALNWLQLNNNQLTGEIPTELSNLKNLEYLRLSDNQFEGSIPAALSQLSKLLAIFLDHNQLSGPIPPALGNLKLKIFHVHNNRLSGSIPIGLGQWTELQYINLSYNELSGEILPAFCAIDSLIEIDLDHNKFHIADSAPLACLHEKDPDVFTTQTVPPTNLSATALSRDTVRLDWLPISYTADGGYYAIVAAPVLTPTQSITQTTANKRVERHDFTGLMADVAYTFSVRTYTQLLDLWSEPSVLVTATPRNTFVTVVDEGGNPLSGVGVTLYSGIEPQETLMTDQAGHVFFANPQVNHKVAAFALQSPQSAIDAGSCAAPFCIYTTSMDVLPDGTVLVHEIKQAGEQVLTVKTSNTLVLYNLVVSVEWQVYSEADQNPAITTETLLKELSRGLRSASAYLYDVTDGQFAFGTVTVYDNGRHWDDADLQILVSNQVRPSATVGGIVESAPFTYTSSVGNVSVAHPGFFRMGRKWDGAGGSVGGLDEKAAFRTLIHEFAHYALFLEDQYYLVQSDGTIAAAHCTSPQNSTSGTEEPMASIMYWQYTRSELSWQGDNPMLWSETCEQTQQWAVHGESDWETVAGIYADRQDPQRWRILTPADRGGNPNPGPAFMPLDLPQITIVAPENPDDILVSANESTLDVRNATGALLPAQSVQIYLFEEEQEQIVGITDQGTSNGDGKIELLGVQPNDTVKAINWDGSLYESTRLDPGTSALNLQPAAWNPLIDAVPFSSKLDFGKPAGITVTVSQLPAAYTPVDVTIFSIGGSSITTATLQVDPDKNNTYVGELGFSAESPFSEGHLWIRATDANGQLVETVTTYALGGGAPSSYARAHPPLHPASSDGNLRLYIPDESIGDDAAIIVMQTRGIPALPANVTLVSTPYTIRASDGITQIDNSLLTMFFNQEAADDVEDLRLLHIYHWNEQFGQWTDQDGVVDERFNFIATSIDQVGIYAVVAEKSVLQNQIYLPHIRR